MTNVIHNLLGNIHSTQKAENVYICSYKLKPQHILISLIVNKV